MYIFYISVEIFLVDYVLTWFVHSKANFTFNPNKQGIGEKSPTFVQNNFTHCCLKENKYEESKKAIVFYTLVHCTVTTEQCYPV